MTTLDEIQARADETAAFFSGPHDFMPTHYEDRAKLVAALRAVEAVHHAVHYDKWARKHESPQGHGGWCSSCGRFDGEGCLTITAIREALG